MEFLSPLFWFGAAAITVPILLHLVQREKKDRVPFASLMLMPRLPVKQMRRRQLKHLLLLFLRCLGILLIVTAFARPLVTGAWFDRFNPIASRSVVILVDNSYSMSRPSVWQRATEAARDRIQALGDGDEAMLIQYNDSASVLTPWEKSREALLGALAGRVKTSFAGTAYLEALRLASEQFDDDRRPEKEIYWITDLQAAGLSSSQGWKVPEGIRVEIEDVGEPTSNLYIDEVRIEGRVYSKQYPHPILVRLAQSPPGPASGELQFRVEDAIVSRQPFTMEDQGVAQVTLPPFDVAEGITRGRIVLDADDALPEDNSFYFVLERQRPRKVYIVSERGRQSAFFLQKALSAGSNLPFEVEVTPRLPSDLSPQTTAAVILDDVRRPPSAASLKPFVEAGGGLIVTLGRQLRPSAWEGWDTLLPAALGERKYVRSRSKSFTSITEVSWDHPIFAVFQDSHRAALASAQFYSFWELKPRPEAASLAGFDEGLPALVQGRLGEGRVLMFAVAADPALTDFQIRSSFLPFWDRVLEFAAGWEGRPPFMHVNQVLAPPGDQGEAAQAAWDLIDPSGQKVVGIEGVSGEPLRLELPGIYEVRSNRATDYVAANLRREESDLRRVRAENLLALLVPGESQSVAGEAEAEAVQKESQQSLWWLFLLAGALVLCLEAWVANNPRLRQAQSNA